MLPGEQIGPYTLTNRIGQGAFGEVWVAERRTEIATTKVAVKIPLDRDADIELIKREANLWVQASGHPNVLQIIEANIYDGQIVIVSEYAPDGSLSQWLLDQGGCAPSAERAIEMTVGILAGLQHLHQKKIVHRDLKPPNVLLQNETPRLADFGISRVLSTSRSGTIAGTPCYMAPEAFDGERNEQTDIWSVGVVLYELLSGRLPFPQDNMAGLIAAIVNQAPAPLDSTVPKVLQDVVNQSLSKAPASRFQTAAEMRTALRDAEREVDRIRRSPDATNEPLKNPLPVVSSQKIVGRKNLSERFREAVRSIFLLEPAAKPPQPRAPIKNWLPIKTWKGDYGLSPSAWAFDGKTLAAFYKAGSLGSKRAVIRRLYLWHIPSGLSLVVLKFNQATYDNNALIDEGAFSPDARTFVYGDTTFDRKGFRRTRNLLQFCDTHTDSSEGTYKVSTDGDIGCLKFSRTGRYLAFAHDRDIKIWDSVKGAVYKSFPSRLGQLRYLDFSPDEKLLLGVGGGESGVRVWDWQSGKLNLSALVGKTFHRLRPAFSPDGSTLATTNSDSQIVLWDLTTNELSQVFDTEEFDGTFLSYSPDGTTLACHVFDEGKLGLRFFDVKTGRLERVLDENRELCGSAFSSDGNFLVNWCTDQSITLWKAE